MPGSGDKARRLDGCSGFRRRKPSRAKSGIHHLSAARAADASRVAEDRRQPSSCAYSSRPSAFGLARAKARERMLMRATRANRPSARHGGQRTEAAAPARHIDKARIAGEKLIATKPGERHLQSGLLRGLRDEPRVHTIDRGLIHRLENRRKIVVETPARSHVARCVWRHNAWQRARQAAPRPRACRRTPRRRA